VPAVGITTGQPRDVLLAAGACVLVEDFHALLDAARAHEAAAAQGSGSGSGGSAGARVEAAAVRVQA
jgi:hypothetical protein